MDAQTRWPTDGLQPGTATWRTRITDIGRVREGPKTNEPARENLGSAVPFGDVSLCRTRPGRRAGSSLRRASDFFRNSRTQIAEGRNDSDIGCNAFVFDNTLCSDAGVFAGSCKIAFSGLASAIFDSCLLQAAKIDGVSGISENLLETLPQSSEVDSRKIAHQREITLDRKSGV